VEKMEIQIKHTDAFRELCKITMSNDKFFEQKILNGLDSINFLMDWSQEAGKTIGDLIDEHSDHTIEEVVQAIFPSGMFNGSEEVKEFTRSVLLWGNGSQNPCSQCGCEMEGEEDGMGKTTWIDWKCSNPNCDNADSGEPDWDGLPGGYNSKY
jgi:hypothetical protein